MLKPIAKIPFMHSYLRPNGMLKHIAIIPFMEIGLNLLQYF